MYVKPIRRLQVDLSTLCNAHCLFCSRLRPDGSPNSFFPANSSLDEKLFAKALRDPALTQLEEIFFCGNYGDALASPNLLNILTQAELYSARNLRWNIHTNGSLGSEDTWLALAEKTRSHGRLVKFSIDGLADTNHLYRRGVKWERVMRNSRAFIENGGRAVWKFIEFNHNKHQVEEARALAKELGFLRFELRKNYAPEREQELLRPLPSTDDLMRPNAPPNRAITCQSQIEDTLYLDFDGLVWPCCWIADWKHDTLSSKRAWHRENIEAPHEIGFNSLAHHSLAAILRQPWFAQRLPDSWAQSENSHPACAINCGTCKN